MQKTMQYYSPVQQNWESMTSVKPQPFFAAAESRMFSLSQWGINHFPHLCHIFLVFSFCKNTKWNFNFLLKSCNNGWSSSIIWRFSLYFCVLPEKNICYKYIVEFCIVSFHLQSSLSTDRLQNTLFVKWHWWKIPEHLQCLPIYMKEMWSVCCDWQLCARLAEEGAACQRLPGVAIICLAILPLVDTALV